MNTTGKMLIDSLCKRLKNQGKLCTDGNIMILLNSLDQYQVNQLVTFGTVDKWERKFMICPECASRLEPDHAGDLACINPDCEYELRGK